MHQRSIYYVHLSVNASWARKRVSNKMSESKPARQTVTACMIIIGNEILSGRTQDTNLRHLSKVLNTLGIRLTESRIIPDVIQVIVNTVNAVRTRFDYIFTTGGIGPTHDDITAESMAQAFGVPLEIHPEIEALIRKRQAPPEVMKMRLLMARTPAGARLIGNPSGGPQGFQIGNVFVMAGVPAVMQAMASTLDNKRLPGGDPLRSKTIGAYLGESQIAEQLGAIQSRYPSVDLGSYPFYLKEGYGTNLVVRGTDEAELETLCDELKNMIVALGAEAHEDGV